MITAEQVMLKQLELNKMGRESLLHRGVETPDDITAEEIMQKIKEIPIYKFEPMISAEMSIKVGVCTHHLEASVTTYDAFAEETNIILERGS